MAVWKGLQGAPFGVSAIEGEKKKDRRETGSLWSELRALFDLFVFLVVVRRRTPVFVRCAVHGVLTCGTKIKGDEGKRWKQQEWTTS
jgi:hypothetical protein